MTSAVDDILDQFKSHFRKYPSKVQFDHGKEFYNVSVENLLENLDIEYFSTKSDKKAAIVERFNRTLKTMMWTYFYSKKTYQWIDVLDDLVHNYNNTKHSSILMKPAEVNPDTESQVVVTLYGHAIGDLPIPKLKVGA